MERNIWSIAVAVTGVVSVSVTKKIWKRRVSKEHEMAEKHLAIIKVFNKWLRNKQEKKDIAKFFEEEGYHSIAIYGMSFLGKRLLDELQESDVIVKYAIDKNAENIRSKIDVMSSTDDLPEVDAIIVTAVYFFEEIKEKIYPIVKCPVISLEDIVYEV